VKFHKIKSFNPKILSTTTAEVTGRRRLFVFVKKRKRK